MLGDPSQIALALIWFVVFLFSTTLHEASHAFIAHRLGDSTAYKGGQVTLNPIPHIRREPLGMVVVPLISFIGAGWMLGWASAPYDPSWAERHPRRAALMALGGPASNLFLAVVAAALIYIGRTVGFFQLPSQLGYSQLIEAVDPANGGAAAFVSVLFTLNLVLCIFNLLPVPPLDGSSIVQLFMPESVARRYQSLLRQPMIGLMGLFIAWNAFGPIFYPVFRLALRLLHA